MNTTPTPRILMCPPDHFGIEYEINPWMNVRVGSDAERSRRQWDALVETLDQLQNEYGVKVDYLRLKAYPFTRETHDFIAAHKRVYIIDQNRDGQMHELLKLDVAVPEMKNSSSS